MPANAFVDIGDRLTRALLSGDFDLYRTVMDLPLRIEPREGTPYELHTLAALRDDFDLYHTTIQTHGVTDIFRDVLSITEVTPLRVEIACTTHILARANRVIDPFPTLIVLRPVAGDWRIGLIQSSEGHINWTLGRETISGGGFPPSDPA